MEYAAVPSQTTRKSDSRYPTQIFFIGCAIGWLLFLSSSLQYKNLSWFPILFGGRLLLFISSLALCITTYFHKSLSLNNIQIIYLLICLAFQALCGTLEGAHNKDFTIMMSVFIIMIPVFHKNENRIWAYRIYPIICMIVSIPFFFKSYDLLLPIGAFTDNFSAIVSSVVISFLIGRATASKNEALQHAEELQAQLTQERDCQKQIIEQQTRELANSRVTARIAEATQMVAHDVRRPFSMLRTAINLIRNAKSPEQIISKSTALIQNVENSLDNVDKLISDIIAISNQATLKLVSLKLENIIVSVVSETLTQNKNMQIEFNFSLNHNKFILGDENKLRRVIENIITNAIEAMSYKGTISFVTQNKKLQNKEYIEISIYNSGPLIAEEDIAHVFDSFFTKGKQSGTGLGLAIAKTFIESHEGEIACESSNTTGVCFYFTLLTSGEIYTPINPVINQPKYDCEKSVEITEPLSIVKSGNSDNLKSNFQILIVEDEKIFQEGILNEVEKISIDGYEINTSAVNSADEAFKFLKTNKPNLILLDIDLGPNSPDGLKFLKEIRSQGIDSFVCIHSNRTFFDAGISIKDLKADLAIPKPMTLENLSFIISQAVQKNLNQSIKPKVVVVDDDKIFLMDWKETMLDAEVLTFSDPEDFWDAVIEKPNVLSNISCIILDYYFRGNDVKKLGLVPTLRNKDFQGPIILSSNANFKNESEAPNCRFDYVIKKRAMTFSELSSVPEIAALIQKRKSQSI